MSLEVSSNYFKPGESETGFFKGLEDLTVWVNSHLSLFEAPAIVLLNGELGAGKTTLVTKIVEALGGSFVSSPTFSLHQNYETPKISVDHMDLYRMKGDEDLESSGFFDLLKLDDSLFIVEWAERLPTEVFFISKPVFEVYLTHVKEDSEKRELKITRIF